MAKGEKLSSGAASAADERGPKAKGEKLSPAAVARLVRDRTVGKHAVGGVNNASLVLVVRPTGSESWMLRARVNGERLDRKLGAYAATTGSGGGLTLDEARKAAGKLLLKLHEGDDPAVQARAARAEKEAGKAAGRATLASVAHAYWKRVIEPSRSETHAKQWWRSLELQGLGDKKKKGAQDEPGALVGVWNRPVGAITRLELLDPMTDLQARIPETASRILQRLELIFDDAEFRELSVGNPARAIRPKLKEALAGGKRKRGKFAMLPFAQAPAFMAALRAREGISARALEFAVLTAARTSEVLGATWDEFDLGAGTWVVPGARMKGGEVHTVYLSRQALSILDAMREHGQDLVFPAADGGRLSNMAMLALLRRMDKAKVTTVHGLCRATFSTWANETGAARSDVVEACLAHQEADRVRASYNRAEFTAQRAALLRAWADYLGGGEPAAASPVAERPVTVEDLL